MREIIKKILKKNMGILILMTICIVASVLLSLLPPLALEKVVNTLTSNQRVGLELAFLYFGLTVISNICESAKNSSITIVGQKITHGIRSILGEKLNRLPTDYYIKHGSGKVTSVFVNDADTIDTLFSDGIVGMFADGFKLFGILFIITSKSLGLGIIIFLLMPFIYFLTKHFQMKTLLAQVDNRKAIARVNNHVPETIRNIRMIHVFEKEKYMEDKYDDYILESYKAVNRSNTYDSLYSPIILIIKAIVILIMMTTAAAGEDFQKFFGISVGSAVAITAYVGKIFTPIEAIGMEIQNVQSALAGIKRIEEFLKEEEISKEPEKTKLDYVKKDYENCEIVFDNVTFSYNDDKQILNNFSFSIKKGEKVTLLGRTGAGKSTVFKLLLGLYFPDEGAILVEGKHPGEINFKERRKIFGCVEQDLKEVLGNLREQITLFDEDITDEMIWKALDTVGLRNVVEKLPEGLETKMKAGLFSRGQIQLLSIARAIVTSPSILLLDEITANLDSDTEKQVIDALNNASKGKTVLSISHRLSTFMENEKLIYL
ncbi:ABC-type multidrug transport system, ATPase and permease component [Acetitomaculum ruminis DSM 5522]|uniref:ABC-type multidrug transport system, ATPase and permease component n=1 Tax=Acetitomaculum ruminis DSM 5522 TaxID=1120918 RepID=A0A1I0WMW9_9FIRM|nr:ABC transporter ATP-binding protein [Acetitomaculum ruminis]SFA89548.1 ABC-type multidrug transport system, ATPase and permease component [Acetitomaculum ruminis DSM 5522]